MNNKTPKFTKALNEILENLKPHSRRCQECGKDFEIMVEDIEFYKKLQVPPTNFCYQCFQQRLTSHRYPFIPIFYKKSCSAPGHQEKVIAMYADKNPVKVYDDQYYLSDKWEASEFYIDFDLEQDFFKQYQQLNLRVPHQTLFKDSSSVKSDYVIAGQKNNSCYYDAIPINSERVYYSFLPFGVKDSVALSDIQNSEKCFDCISSSNLYQCIFVMESSSCLNSSFLYDCKNCQNCFMSANLRNKSYVFRNQQLTKEEYGQKVKEINFGSKKVYQKLQIDFQDLIKKSIKKGTNVVKSVNFVGDNIINCKNCYFGFRIYNSEDIRYGASFTDCKDLMNSFGGLNTSLGYAISAFYSSSDIKFCLTIRDSVKCEYCTECVSCTNCFACVGLKNKKYHIFNKAYREEEYWQKVDELKTKMLERGEYGEVLSSKLSIFPYQDSGAQAIFPLTEEEIKKKGWHWQDEVKSEIDLTKIKTIKGEEVPDDIKDVNDNILKTPIICERTNKPFKITSYELEFYRKMNVPLPTIHPEERVKEKFKIRPVYKAERLRLYNVKCEKCQQDMFSVYSPGTTERVYCEKCYNEEVV